MARNAHPEVTRQRILDAAKKLFAQKGYERTTIQDILDELEDLSKGAIYHHFKNKEAMLHALIDSDNERLLPQANQEDGSRNGLQKLRNSLMMQITDTEHMTLMRDAFPLLNDPKILAENLRIWRTDSTKIAYDFIQEGLRDGSITTEYPQEAAELFSLLFNYWLAPNFYPITTLSEFKHRIHCLGLIMDSLGVPLIDHDSDMEDRLAEGFFLLASNPQQKLGNVNLSLFVPFFTYRQSVSKGIVMKNSSAKTLQSSLRSANFILLVLGQGISLFGNTMLRFAMSMWVLDETASSTTFATVLAISVIPTILISPFGGVMADRVSKRAMMVALDIISGIVTLLATVFFALSGFNILAIAIMQVVLAVLDAMETPVVQSALPQIIGRESSTDLRRGAAIINQVQQLSQLLPSFLGGVMYGLVGIRPMMLITAACLLSAAMVECFIRLAKPLSNQDDAGICLLDVIIGDMHSATVFLLRKEPTVARLAGVCTWINLILTGFSSVSFPYIIRTTLGYDAATYGLCDGIIGIAGIAGTFIAGCFANRLKSRNAPSLLFVESLMLLPPAIAFLLPCSTQTKLIMLVLCTAAVIIAVDFLNLILVPSIQMRTPTALTGKVMAIILSLTICAQPLGQMLYGWLHAHCSVWLILLISALASLPLAWLARPLFAHLDDTISK